MAKTVDVPYLSNAGGSNGGLLEGSQFGPPIGTKAFLELLLQLP